MNRSSHAPARRKSSLAAVAALAVAAAVAGPARPARAGDDAQKIDFVKDVQPIFKASCLKCHGKDEKKPKKKAAAGLWLDDKAAAMKGGRSGAAIIPGNAKDSLLFKLLNGTVTVDDKGKDREISAMPKVKKGEKWKPLSADQLATIKQWIDQGASWAP